MKQVLRFLFLILTVSLILSASAFIPAALGDFDDVAEHWAETTLRRALVDGLIVGDSGLLRPDDPVSAAQALTIICRVLGAETESDLEATGLTGEEWYYSSVAKSMYLGIISPGDNIDFNAPMSREDAFHALAEAFRLADSQVDTAILSEYTDTWQIVGDRRLALATLLSRGVISGHDRTLRVEDNATRAEFLSALYRIAGEFHTIKSARDDYAGGVVIQGSAELTGTNFLSGVWFDCTATDIRLDRVNADNVVILSHVLDSLIIGGMSQIGSLTLAAQSGDITIAPVDDASVGRLIIGSGSGRVVSEGIEIVEVAGDYRHVTIEGRADAVTVSGRNNTIVIQPGAVVGTLELTRDAKDCRIFIEGNVNDFIIRGEGSATTGRGHIRVLSLSNTYSHFSVRHGVLYDLVDRGLEGASVRLNIPAVLPIGSTLNIETILENVEPGKVCEVSWFLDGQPVRVSSVMAGGALPVLTRDFDYHRDLAESVDIGVTVRYNTMHGEFHELSDAGTVIIENYDKAYWMSLDAPAVLAKVTLGYLGDFTLEWAEANDLDEYDKEVWVNAKGYSSTSEYLIWVNLAYQRVNIFMGSTGNWELIRSCIVGSGRPGAGTMTGVTVTTYKQLPGWTTATYTVRPVVRFRPDTGYAFHSRLYAPFNTDRLVDDSIGFPVSSGCIRMYDEDIWFIYDYIPNGTTVVIF